MRFPDRTSDCFQLPYDRVSSLWFGKKRKAALCGTDEDTEAQRASMPCPRSLHTQPAQDARNFATAVFSTDGFWAGEVLSLNLCLVDSRISWFQFKPSLPVTHHASL